MSGASPATQRVVPRPHPVPASCAQSGGRSSAGSVFISSRKPLATYCPFADAVWYRAYIRRRHAHPGCLRHLGRCWHRSERAKPE